MRTRGYFWLSVALSSALLFPATAIAETIRISSGFLNYNGSYNLVGDRRGFRLFGNVFEGDSPNLHVFCPGDLCSPGVVALVRHASSGLDFEGPQATLDGVFHEEVNSLSGTAWADVGFSSSTLLPPISSTAVLRTPFMMEGSFSVVEEPSVERLIGSGIATTTWKSAGPDENGHRTWFLAALRYDFFGAAPIPEPTTLVLAGVAAAAAAFSRRKRRVR